MNAVSGLKKHLSPADRHIGAKVKEARLFRHMSQEQLGTALKLTFQQIQKYERGENRVSAGRLFDIANTLGVAVVWFYEGLDAPAAEGEPPPALDHAQRKLLESFDRIEDRSVRLLLASFVEDLAGNMPKREHLAEALAS